jgi:UDP-N-acetylmuramyl pentapeptide phosphotransferase/UDP-N-acetylglucosamine-1-phosphate transferase
MTRRSALTLNSRMRESLVTSSVLMFIYICLHMYISDRQTGIQRRDGQTGLEILHRVVVSVYPELGGIIVYASNLIFCLASPWLKSSHLSMKLEPCILSQTSFP